MVEYKIEYKKNNIEDIYSLNIKNTIKSLQIGIKINVIATSTTTSK